MAIFIIMMAHPIRKAEALDRELVFGILLSTSEGLPPDEARRLEDTYTKENFQKRVGEKEVYLIYSNEVPSGTVTLDISKPFYHLEDERKFWEGRSAGAAYIRSLAVLPERQRMGLATELLRFAEAKAAEHGILRIRLSTSSPDPRLARFYLDRGYKMVGKSIRDGVEKLFFEKVME